MATFVTIPSSGARFMIEPGGAPHQRSTTGAGEGRGGSCTAPVHRVQYCAKDEEEQMKRIFAVLAIVAALAISVAAQTSQGPQNSHGQCASSSHGACARAGH